VATSAPASRRRADAPVAAAVETAKPSPPSDSLEDVYLRHTGHAFELADDVMEKAA
jgi:hypothetical protein